MSELNTTLVVQLNEAANLPSSGSAPTASTSLAASSADAKLDGSLGILIDGAYESAVTPVLAGADEKIILCTSHLGKKGSTVYTASSEFKRSEIVSTSYSVATADVARVELDPNGASGTDNDGALAKAGRFGNGTVKGVRRYETLSSISSGAFNQYTYDKVNPLTNVDTGQDFDSYTITVRKKNAGRYTTEVIRVYINHLAEYTKYALETTLGLGALADVTGPTIVVPTWTVPAYASNATQQGLSGTLGKIAIAIDTAEVGGSYSLVISNDQDSDTYTKSASLGITGNATLNVAAGTTTATFDWTDLEAGDVLTLAVTITDPFGNDTVCAPITHTLT
tara:strand:- start:14719 stop:15729 length:1011 start_codon:yes stop_codon:yes gene_type:complete